jgi:hypothetical protein
LEKKLMPHLWGKQKKIWKRNGTGELVCSTRWTGAQHRWRRPRGVARPTSWVRWPGGGPARVGVEANAGNTVPIRRGFSCRVVYLGVKNILRPPLEWSISKGKTQEPAIHRNGYCIALWFAGFMRRNSIGKFSSLLLLNLFLRNWNIHSSFFFSPRLRRIEAPLMISTCR